MPRVLVSVTNDLNNDQRVHKVCLTLQDQGLEVLLIGRLLPDSRPIHRSYRTHRMRLFFRRGPLFYAEYNLRLFFFLIRQRMDILHSNDLDTLLPNFLVSRIRRTPLVYDTHEYFTGVPELRHRPLVRRIWRQIEAGILPRLEYIFTVNSSIAQLYAKDYGISARVLRNVPLRLSPGIEPKSRADIGIPEDAFLLVNQGTGINLDRGMEELFGALEKLPSEVHLLLIGKGDVIPSLKQRAQESSKLGRRVHFIPPLPYEEMMRHTMCCDLGLSLDKDTNINYRFSLPNKVFDYIRAGIPLLTTDLPEVGRIVRTYDVGLCIEECNEAKVEKGIMHMMSQGKERFAKALERASQELCWEEEVQTLVACYGEIQNKQ